MRALHTTLAQANDGATGTSPRASFKMKMRARREKENALSPPPSADATTSDIESEHKAAPPAPNPPDSSSDEGDVPSTPQESKRERLQGAPAAAAPPEPPSNDAEVPAPVEGAPPTTKAAAPGLLGAPAFQQFPFDASAAPADKVQNSEAPTAQTAPGAAAAASPAAVAAAAPAPGKEKRKGKMSFRTLAQVRQRMGDGGAGALSHQSCISWDALIHFIRSIHRRSSVAMPQLVADHEGESEFQRGQGESRQAAALVNTGAWLSQCQSNSFPAGTFACLGVAFERCQLFTRTIAYREALASDITISSLFSSRSGIASQGSSGGRTRGQTSPRGCMGAGLAGWCAAVVGWQPQSRRGARVTQW